MKNKIIGIAGVLAVVIAGLSYGGMIAWANPLDFTIQNKATCTPTATTTLSYLSAGMGTTTYTYDTFAPGCTDPYSTDKLSFLIQATGSSTATTYNVTFEYSQDGVDWYSDGQSGFQSASTTGQTTVSSDNLVSFAYASSTTDGLRSLTDNKIINVLSPTREVRAVVTLPVGSTNGAVWGEFVGQKQEAE